MRKSERIQKNQAPVRVLKIGPENAQFIAPPLDWVSHIGTVWR
ncbi:hypothetical protein THTE_0925 [Thermogutta terrifontis]|uniref:Uncharacterized protein n=1 Tax=Thermogutta terrifontis TaxID=1331910 RepID=A0A286RC74_9BACT|nr:hypothetical protein THTE_0925 [Thermogutta terrifontis]